MERRAPSRSITRNNAFLWENRKESTLLGCGAAGPADGPTTTLLSSCGHRGYTTGFKRIASVPAALVTASHRSTSEADQPEWHAARTNCVKANGSLPRFLRGRTAITTVAALEKVAVPWEVPQETAAIAVIMPKATVMLLLPLDREDTTISLAIIIAMGPEAD